MPDWANLHPIVVHLPIGILAITPALVLATLLLRPWRKGLALATLLALVAGAGAAWLAAESGEAAAQLIEKQAKSDEALEATLEKHEEMAEQCLWIFAVLAAAYAVAVAGPLLLRGATPGKVLVGVQVVFLLLLVGALTRLAWTGHYGGLLVHKHGVHANMPAEPVGPGSGE
jgi:uncharacterized membrane protein